MKIAIAQTQLLLGDFHKNCEKVLDLLKKAQNKADILIFPEGGLWAYPPKDFLYQEKYFQIQKRKLSLIHSQIPKGLKLLMPAFIKGKNKLQNGVYLLESGKKPLFFAKEFLPDQSVFFESRYFEKGAVKKNVFYCNKKKIQILICEDLWQVPSIEKPDLLISLNASPYTDQKQKKRLKKLKDFTKKYRCPAVYLNCTGAQDSLIFDGGSFALNSQGEILWQGAFFKPDFKILKLFPTGKKKKRNFLKLEEQREQAVKLGIKSFFTQTGFSKAHLGLSGGIDSALVAYLAVQALGSQNVKAFFLPGPYTQNISYEIVKKVARNLKISLKEQNISSVFQTFSDWFSNGKAYASPLTSQNLQARIRSLFLMAWANETNSLLLGTGNKSELITGYSTLYGDMTGAICPIGDLLKTEVYKLSHFINKKAKVFPKALLKREPSAELAPKQKDRDELPSYDKLDKMLEGILKNKTPQSAKEKNLVQRIQKQEFKRQQAPLILKLSETDLGESWRRPIAHQFPS